jgi:hypothetical protein
MGRVAVADVMEPSGANAGRLSEIGEQIGESVGADEAAELGETGGRLSLLPVATGSP